MADPVITAGLGLPGVAFFGALVLCSSGTLGGALSVMRTGIVGVPLLATTSAQAMRRELAMAVSKTATDLIERWRGQGQRSQILRFVQPSLIGLIDGTISTLAPIFAAAFIAGSHAALLVGLAASLGAAISMGLSEALSDDGEVSGRGTPLVRGALTGMATFVGGTFHALPFLISDTPTALKVAYVVVGMELITIAWVRRRFLQVPLHRSLVQVTVGGVVVAGLGAVIGHT
jgi:erythrin-vacuolar iron transport family protein